MSQTKQSDTDSPALVFTDVQKQFGDFHALKGVSFSVKQGDFFALLGPNGAGKTTLINCLAGLTRRSSGDIFVLGEDPEKNPTFTKQVLGIVEQELTFDPFFTPMEILRLRRGLFGQKRNDEYLLWLLEKLNLSDKRDSAARALSGGMKRRLMIAKALAHEPEILVLDEPTAGVDVELRQNLWAFVRELRKEKNMTILLTTHYLEEAEQLASRVAILQKGEIIMCDETKKILKDQKRILEVETQDGKTERHTLDKDANLADILRTYKNLKDIRIQEPKLEDVFLEITRSHA